MPRTARMVVGTIGVLLVAALASQAADLNKAVSEAEGRRRAATKRRSSAAASLKERLRWKMFDEI